MCAVLRVYAKCASYDVRVTGMAIFIHMCSIMTMLSEATHIHAKLANKQ
ncbi:hypothetical protein [Paenibacillus alvei]|uniref:Uncharacterized protein n=1 Tax=Paenibacillus alvei TaxID=44250 RepID=A0AAP6ZVP6_PAEAL|nr:hypothetical protein [Paenibacillus alvei]MCY9580033.1 hypothetical protein [Paenibacillus alvei]NOJ70571.1 hypothetical protein [Paenibacillus alvei]